MENLIELSEKFFEYSGLKWKFGRVIAQNCEEISIYMDPIAYAESKNINLIGAIAECGYEPNTFILGILQYKMKNILECFLNSHELGLDAGPVYLQGDFPINRIFSSTLKIYTKALMELGNQDIKEFHDALLKIESNASIPLIDAAALIAEFYSTFENIIANLEFRDEKYIFTCPGLINKSGYLQIEDEFSKTVVDMCNYVESNIEEDVVSFIIHGSYADLNIAKNYSDLDTFAIIKKSVCKNPEALLKLRDKIKPLWQFFYKIDPLQHHGVMLMSEFDMGFYPTAFAPYEMFENALSVCYTNEKLTYYLRDCEYERKAFFYHIVQTFRFHFLEDTNFCNQYSLKHFVSTLMLIPSLFLQSKGKSIYKGKSFCLFSEQYSEGSRLIDKATQLRNSWSLDIDKKKLKEINILKGIIPWDSWLVKYHELIHANTRISKEISDAITDLKYEIYLLVNKLWSEYQSKDFKKKEVEYVDFPISYSMLDYNESLVNVCNEIERNYNNPDIYLFGSIKAPGISDIDLIICTDNKDHTALNNVLNIWHDHSERDKYIFIHEPSMIVNSKFLDHIAELYPVFSIAKVSDGIRGEKILLKQDKFQQLLALVEISCTFFFNDTVWNYLNSRIPIRFVLMRASGLSSSIKILEEFIPIEPAMKDLVERIHLVKINWFSYNEDEKKKQILAIVKYGISLQLYIIKELDGILQRELGILDDDDRICGVLDQNVFFKSNWSPNNCLRIISEAFKEYGTLVSVLPKSFGVILGSYIKYNKILSQQFADRFVSICGETLKNPGIKHRTELLSNHIHFLNGTGLEWGGVPHLGIRPQLSKVNKQDWQKVMDSYLDSSGNHTVLDYLCYININNSSRLRKCLDNGEFKECIEIGESIVEKVTNVAENYYLLGFAYQMIGEPTKALINYNKADTLGFPKFWICYNRGQLYYTIGEREKARADLTIAFQIDPEHSGIKEIIELEQFA